MTMTFLFNRKPGFSWPATFWFKKKIAQNLEQHDLMLILVWHLVRSSYVL